MGFYSKINICFYAKFYGQSFVDVPDRAQSRSCCRCPARGAERDLLAAMAAKDGVDLDMFHALEHGSSPPPWEDGHLTATSRSSSPREAASSPPPIADTAADERASTSQSVQAVCGVRVVGVDYEVGPGGLEYVRYSYGVYLGREPRLRRVATLSGRFSDLRSKYAHLAQLPMLGAAFPGEKTTALEPRTSADANDRARELCAFFRAVVLPRPSNHANDVAQAMHRQQLKQAHAACGIDATTSAELCQARAVALVQAAFGHARGDDAPLPGAGSGSFSAQWTEPGAERAVRASQLRDDYVAAAPSAAPTLATPQPEPEPEVVPLKAKEETHDRFGFALDGSNPVLNTPQRYETFKKTLDKQRRKFEQAEQVPRRIRQTRIAHARQRSTRHARVAAEHTHRRATLEAMVCASPDSNAPLGCICLCLAVSAAASRTGTHGPVRDDEDWRPG
eukprot:COSAG05_NODE_2361_length_3178_cov_23.311465_1_plen_449_part_00